MDLAFLKKIPLTENKIFRERYPDYGREKSNYQKLVISQIAVSVAHLLASESLVTCREYGLRFENYYMKSPLVQQYPEIREYLTEEIFLRQSVAADLQIIDEWLRRQYLCLFIFSGYRHPKLQQAILTAARLKVGEKADKLLANPQYYSPHATGAVFDLEVWDMKNDCLLPTKTSRGIDRLALESGDLKAEEEIVRDNRRLIHHLLTTDFILPPERVFIPHPFEYWHYGRNERLSAFFSGQTDYPVFYEQIF